MTVAGLFLLALLLSTCCYLPTAAAFHDRSRRVTYPQALLYTAIGLGALGVLGICCKAAGLDMRFSVLPGLLVAALALRKNPASWMPQPSPASLRSPRTWWALGASAVSFLYVLAPGLLMGRGEYPPVFFNVDTAFYLGQIHSLLHNSSWPPPSLTASGFSYGYHYGSQSACAVLSLCTGMAPHLIAFLVFMPLVQLGIISAAWLIAEDALPEENDGRPWWIIPFLLFCTTYPLGRLLLLSGQAPLLSIGRIPLDPQSFQGGYPMLSTQFGMLAAFASIYCLQRFADPSRRRLLTFLVAVVIVFKSPYFIVLGGGFGLWALYEWYTTRKFSPLWGPGLSLGAGLFLNGLAGPGQSVTAVLAPWQLFHFQNVLWDTLGLFALSMAPGILILATLRATATPGGAWRYLACFSLPALLFVNTVGLLIDGELHGDLLQVVFILPIFVNMFSVHLILNNWKTLGRRLQRTLATGVAVIVLPVFAHRLVQTGLLLLAPEKGHEYVNNTAAGQALARIPVRNSLIVTNDFHYPAQHDKRDLHQTQLPALFGHQMYASNFSDERFADAQRRLDLQKRFRREQWDPELERIARAEGWTHLVIHRASPHPRAIPLPLLFENGDYSVYRFAAGTAAAPPS